MFEDRSLVCQSCGQAFDFTSDEQAFFAEKGFQEPKKCKPCRQAAKQSRFNRGGGGGYRGGGGGGGYRDRAPRELYDVVCSACGIQTQVPFEPHASKPVYCKTCYQSAASFSGSGF